MAWAGQGYTGKTVYTQPSTPSSLSSVEVPSGSYPINNPYFVRPTTRTVLELETERAINGLGKGKTEAILYSASALLEFMDLIKKNPGVDLSVLPEEQQARLRNPNLTMNEMDTLSDYLSRQLSNASTPAPVGETLPNVLKSNTKSLVESVGTLTSTFASKFDYFNNYMYGLLQYMDILTGYMNDANTLKQKQYDEAKKAKEDNAVTVGDKKMTPEEIEARKNYAMWQNYAFKTSPVSNAVLEADNVLGMTPLEIEASHRSFEVEAKVYAKNPQKVFDWDNNELADIPPREARLVKDATTAIKHTDENNFELDDEDLEIATPFDISSIFGYGSDAEPLKEFFSRLGGQGL